MLLELDVNALLRNKKDANDEHLAMLHLVGAGATATTLSRAVPVAPLPAQFALVHACSHVTRHDGFTTTLRFAALKSADAGTPAADDDNDVVLFPDTAAWASGRMSVSVCPTKPDIRVHPDEAQLTICAVSHASAARRSGDAPEAAADAAAVAVAVVDAVPHHDSRRALECSSSPCANGGTCTVGTSSFTCACPAAWGGVRCTVAVSQCASSPCRNGGTCLDLGAYNGQAYDRLYGDMSGMPVVLAGACAMGDM